MIARMANRFSTESLLIFLAPFLLGISVTTVAAETSRELAGHIGGVREVSFSSDSSKLVTIGRDGVALIWDVTTGSIVTKIRNDQAAAMCAGFSVDGKILATGHTDGMVALWDTKSGSLLKTIPQEGPRDFFERGEGHVQPVTSLDFSLDGKLLVTGSDDATVKIWNWLERKEIRTLSSHQGNVWAVRFNRDSSKVASISVDGMLILSNVDGSVERQIRLGIMVQPPESIQIDFSQDGKSVAVSFNQEIRLYEVATGKMEHKLGRGLTVAFSPAGNRIAYPSEKIDVSIHDLSAGKVKYVLPDHKGEISSLRFSPDGKMLAVANNRNGSVRLWDLGATEVDTSPLDARIIRRKWLGKKVFPKLSQQERPLQDTRWPKTVDSIEGDWLILGEERLMVSEALLVKDAHAYFTDYLRKSPNSDKALVLRSLVAHHDGQFAKAIADQTKAIQINPKEASYYCSRADAYYEQGKLNEALADYSMAIELDGTNVEPQFHRGLVELKLNQMDEALRDFNNVINLDSKYFAALNQRANIHIHLGKMNEAMQDLEQSLDMNPNQAETLVSKGELLLANRSFEQAIDACTRAIQIDPDMARAYKTRANSHLGMKDETAANLDLRESQRLDPANPTHYLNRPILHFDFSKSFLLGSQMVTMARDVNGRKIKTLNNLNCPVWGPKDNQFAYFQALKDTDQYSLWLGNLSGESTELLRPESNQYFQWYPAWSPDGNRLAFISVQTKLGPQSHAVKFELLVVDTKNGEIKKRVRIPEGVIESAPLSPPNHIKWSPNGKYVLISWERSVVVDLEGERSIAIADGYTVADWSPDGENILYFAFERNESGPNRESISGMYRWSRITESTDVLADKEALNRAGLEMVPGMIRLKMTRSATNRYWCIVSGAVRDFANVTEIRIYRAEQRGQIDLSSPIRTWILESEIPVHVQWSPDDTHLACIMLNEWSTVTVDALRLSTGARRKIADIQFELAGQGVGGLDFLGFGKFLSWSD